MSVVDLFNRDRERDPQEEAADPTLSAFVTANAGSGKTKTLIDRVARLLLAKAKPETILCVTYTKAAASEMQRRLYDRLGGWSVAMGKGCSSRTSAAATIGRGWDSACPSVGAGSRRTAARFGCATSQARAASSRWTCRGFRQRPSDTPRPRHSVLLRICGLCAAA